VAEAHNGPAHEWQRGMIRELETVSTQRII